MLASQARNAKGDGIQEDRFRLVALNRSFAPRYLHRFGSGVGFGAEFVHLLKSFACCLERGIQLCLEGNLRVTGLVVQAGWCDYFAPLFQEVSIPRLEVLTRALSGRWGKLPLARPLARRLLQRQTGCDYFAFDGLSIPPEQIGRAEVGLSQSYWNNMRHLSHMLWEPTPAVKAEIDRLGLGRDLPARYLGVHIRRGDKQSEVAYSPIAAYVAAINALYDPPVSVYVATDDFRTVEELSDQLGPRFQVYTNRAGTLGYDQTRFNSSDALFRWRGIVTLMAELEVLCRAETVIGTSTSNVFSVAQYLRGNSSMLDVDSLG